mgnify:FL=1
MSAILEKINDCLDKDKANNVINIDLKEKSSIADFMIIADGNSSRHISSMANKLLENFKKNKHKVLSLEGLNNSDWILIDIGDIIIHLFKKEAREYYNLEKMWVDKGLAETFVIGSES